MFQECARAFCSSIDYANAVTSNLVTRLQYDALGNLIARTEAEGRPEIRTRAMNTMPSDGRFARSIRPCLSITLAPIAWR
ncbi:hypothetical protein MW7_013310 [Imbroritus primus]|uniref:Uncharacterized protein n=1 Tax=Imbroritus primus TaxID=3058603 RepID=A0ACD3SM30_9BURK|nr:hypothetical protein MW7_013310 [Burkholderiaceae bacterium PBA]